MLIVKISGESRLETAGLMWNSGAIVSYKPLSKWQHDDFVITKTRPCKYTENFLVEKMKIFTGKNLIFYLFLLKTYIVGTR